MATISYYSVYGEILGEEASGTRRDYLTDSLGSVTKTINSSATTENTYTYKPYGEILSRSGSGLDPSFLWCGTLGYRKNVSYSTVYVRAREYVPVIKTWTSRDTGPYEPGFMNEYQYCRNSPCSRIDPTGMASKGCDARVFAREYLCPCKYLCKNNLTEMSDIPNPNFIPKTDCPHLTDKKSRSIINAMCRADHGRQVDPSVSKFMTTARTCRCMAQNGTLTACTIYDRRLWDELPSIYKYCTWIHEKERRQCVFDTCSPDLNNNYHVLSFQWCALSLLRRCFTDVAIRQYFPDCTTPSSSWDPRPSVCRYPPVRDGIPDDVNATDPRGSCGNTAGFGGAPFPKPYWWLTPH